MFNRDDFLVYNSNNYRSGIFGLAFSGICFTLAAFLYIKNKFKNHSKIKTSIYDEPIIDNENRTSLMKKN